MSGKLQVMLDELKVQVAEPGRRVVVTYWEIMPASIFNGLAALADVTHVGPNEIHFKNGSSVLFAAMSEVHYGKQRT